MLLYVSYFLCVYCAQSEVSCDFCMKWFCCCMNTKTIVLSTFGVCVNFKLRPTLMVCYTTPWRDGAGKGRG